MGKTKYKGKDMGTDQGPKRKYKAGYEYLLVYKLTVPIYDYTVEFCDRWIRSYKIREQMIGAGRSGMQNLPEGFEQQGLKGYIKLTGVTKGSLGELLKDFLSFARQRKIPIWPAEKAKKEIKEIEEVWKVIRKHKVLPDSPKFPDLPDDPYKAVNLMITIINQANYLIDKLIPSLKEKHKTEGGLTEKLYRERKKHRGY